MTKDNPFVSPRTMELSDLVDLSSLDTSKRKFPNATTKKTKKDKAPFGPASHSFAKAFAPSSFNKSDGSAMGWSGINSDGVSVSGGVDGGPPVGVGFGESVMASKFLPFLESLKNEENSAVMETIKAGFDACFEG